MVLLYKIGEYCNNTPTPENKPTPGRKKIHNRKSKLSTKDHRLAKLVININVTTNMKKEKRYVNSTTRKRLSFQKYIFSEEREND